jgi:deoxycytidylate deaminase
MLSNKEERLSLFADEMSRKSPMIMRHGAICARGSKIVSRGCNHYRTKFSKMPNKEYCSCHAEMDALYRLKIKNQKKRTIDNLFKNITIYVVKKDRNGNYKDSTPCLDCYNYMKKIGIKKIVYSIDGDIISAKLKNIQPQKISLGRLFIDKGYKRVFRNNEELYELVSLNKN